MYAQCPACLTVFAFDAGVVAQAHGCVGCGHCGATFDTLATLAEQLPAEPFASLPLNASSPAPPVLMTVVFRPQPVAAVATTTVAEPAPDATDNMTAIGESTMPASPAPSFARTRAQRRSASRHALGWTLGCLALALLFAVQLAWAKREMLIADPSIGGWLRRACASLGCTLPPVPDLRRLRLVARDVQAHPGVAGALMISATLHNDASFAQPYPVVTLLLTDASGKRVAMRRLRPAEYLDDDAALRAGLPPGGDAALLLEVVDPGVKAVAFEFGFE
jgi:predicted Zn finger-like uncharacterized protein